MSVLSKHNGSASRAASAQSVPPAPEIRPGDRQLSRWGGVAGLGGVVLMLGSLLVVGSLGLPDASDVETLTDFADIEAGRIAEHFLYLGAVVLFALHALVLYRLLSPVHAPAALFGTAMAEFGLIIMAASSVLHVSTSPLADLYTEPGTTPEDLRSIEHAWHGAQSVFDTMLITGVLLVPIGIVLLGVAMRRAPAFGARLAGLSIGLGTLGIVGAVIAIVDPGSMFAAVSVLVIVVFNLVIGWRTLKLGTSETIDLADTQPAPVA